MDRCGRGKRAAAAAMNRGLVGVERGGGRAGLGRVRVGVWFGPY